MMVLLLLCLLTMLQLLLLMKLLLRLLQLLLLLYLLLLLLLLLLRLLLMLFLLLLLFLGRFSFLDWNERLSPVLVVRLQDHGVDEVSVIGIGLAISGAVAVSRGVIQNLLHPVGVFLRRVDALKDETVAIQRHLETILL